MRLRVYPFIIVICLLVSLSVSTGFTETIPDPETFFGHKPGADYKLIRWEKILE